MSEAEALERIAQLEAAIREVVTQEGDELCWLDAYTKLAHLVGIHFDPKLLPRERFRANCERFAECFYADLPYVSDEPSEALEKMARLEAENALLRLLNLSLAERLAACSEVLTRRAEGCRKCRPRKEGEA